jgi:hypothetical protein
MEYKYPQGGALRLYLSTASLTNVTFIDNVGVSYVSHIHISDFQNALHYAEGYILIFVLNDFRVRHCIQIHQKLLSRVVFLVAILPKK